jgi:hypothetical protein
VLVIGIGVAESEFVASVWSYVIPKYEIPRKPGSERSTDLTHPSGYHNDQSTVCRILANADASEGIEAAQRFRPLV